MYLKKGKLIFFYGPMFSGKSNSLIETYEYSSKSKLIFKPKIDSRSIDIISRTGKKLKTTNVEKEEEIMKQITDDVEEIYIDEVHFFDIKLIDIIQDILEMGIDIYISGLDRDYKQEEFLISRELIDIADYPVRLYARCHNCFKPSIYSIRLKNNELILDEDHPQILIDDETNQTIKYETRCKDCLNSAKRNNR